MNKKILGIDFDNTICWEIGFPKMGELKPNAKKIINQLYNEGYYIIIWTCRSHEQEYAIEEYLRQHGIKYHKINENADFLEFECSPKIFADIYIDDRQLGGVPNDWKEIYKIIKKTN